MSDFNWTCPHCENHVTISDSRHQNDVHILHIENATGVHGLVSRFIVCPNPKCKKYTLTVSINETAQPAGQRRHATSKKLASWRLVPWGASRIFPDYVPQAVRDDYKEACSIVDLSPKAAATLARRAIQGIIRDFWGIVKATLFLELKELDTRVGHDVTQETWDCIDVARSMGNIGAHMEKDINLIIDVDPDEAQTLIELIETLIADTYIARNTRKKQHVKILAMTGKKDAVKGGVAELSPVTPVDAPSE